MTIYEHAGGLPAFQRLAQAQYRRCLEDPILSPIFGTEPRPEHAPRLAAWLAEVFGGPRTYTEEFGGHEGMVGHHLGLAVNEEQRRRFVELMLAAADEAGLPDDERFRRRFQDYVEWGARLAVAFSRPGAKAPAGGAVPDWDWKDEAEVGEGRA
ncbi:MAG TPA: group II truncated hemoglobin [Candidatus Dormibacteraeota bacterium]|jgi:hemoglobin|nr:group II truncated hemoglobin [Candidatus Dormibacteraeota bacterium]